MPDHETIRRLDALEKRMADLEKIIRELKEELLKKSKTIKTK